MKAGYSLIYRFFLFPVYKLFGAFAGDAADIVLSLYGKKPGIVGHACLKPLYPYDLRFGHGEHPAYQLHGLGTRVILIFGIKEAELLKIFEFIDRIVGKEIYVHFNILPALGSGYVAEIGGDPLFCPAFQHLHEHMLPVILLGARHIVIVP